MTDRERDSEASAYLTELLREKCNDARLRVTRVRWASPDSSTVQVDLQLDYSENPSRPLGTFIVILDQNLGLCPPMSCFYPRVLDAVAQAFPCEELRPRPE